MRHLKICIFFAALASVLGALKAPADSIFLTYTGNPYTHTEGSLPRYRGGLEEKGGLSDERGGGLVDRERAQNESL